MCGRYSIYESMDNYLRQLSLDLVVINGYDHEQINRYNVAPSTRVEVIRPAPEGLRVDRVKWGWAPFWAKGKRPDPINARAETVVTGKFFKSLWPNGRALAPANGWYEWIADPADPKRKQPYYIQATDEAPLFFAALAEAHSALEPDERDGFVTSPLQLTKVSSIYTTANLLCSRPRLLVSGSRQIHQWSAQKR